MEHVNKKTGEVNDDRVCTYNERGEEILHDAPLALPVGFKRPQSLQERMKYLLRNELVQRELDAHGVESFDEADDFNVDEPDPLDGTPYEDCFEPEIPGIAAREQEIRAGAVADRPLEKKLKAADTVKRYWRKSQKIKNKAKGKPEAKPEPENDADDDDASDD